MKVCIFGAGAIGGFIGTRLAIAGRAQVTAVARGATLAALREFGWRMRTAGERLARSVSTMPRPIESSPMSANGPTGISPPNSSAIMVSTHGIGSPRAAHAVA